MLRWRGPAAAAMATLALVLSACGAGGDERSPINIRGEPAAAAERDATSYAGAVVPGTPTVRGGTPAPRRSATPAPFAATCGIGGATAARYTQEGRLKSPALPPPPAPVASMAIREDPNLERAIQLSLGDRADAFGVMVVNLADGRYGGLNANRPFYAASLFKLTVLYEVFRQRELGTLSFDERILYTPRYQQYDLGVAPMPVCSEVAVAKAVDLMITISENVSAVLLQDRVGAGAINRDMAALGMPDTTLEADGVTTTAHDMALLLELIAMERAVSPQASREMLDLMLRQTVRNRIPAGLPPGVRSGNKTGDWDGATHDVAIVLAPFGRYVIAVLSEQPSAAPIVALSSAVYRYLATGELPATPSPSATPPVPRSATPGGR